MMNPADIPVLVPFILIAVAATAAMLVVAFHRHHGLTVWVTLGGLFASLLVLAAVSSGLPRQVTPLLIVDGYAVFFIVLILVAAAGIVLFSYHYLQRYPGQREEYYLLLLFAVLGAMVIVSSSHFASFFIGLEILGISMYATIAYLRTSHRAVEAGVKYLILAAVSDSFLLFGMALIYGESGTLEFAKMGKLLGGTYSVTLLAGVALLVTGIGFKLSLVPFHMWTPDVYEGAPAPITGFLATVSKGAVFALLLRFVTEAGLGRHESLTLLFSLLALASMIGGNLLALLQTNVKRILAYASIAHLGYLVVALLAAGTLGFEAVGYYLTAYFIATIGAFGVIGLVSVDGREADQIEDYHALMWRSPWLGGSFTVMLLSMAGIPLTAGFLGKFYVVAAGVKSSLWSLVMIMIVTSVIGLYYYLRIITTMCRPPETATKPAGDFLKPGIPASAVLALLTFFIVWLGVYPALFIDVIRGSLALSLP